MRELGSPIGPTDSLCGQHHWPVVAALTDVASGLNEKRRGLHRLLDLARDHQTSLVVVEYRDRLARLGWGYLETFLHTFGVRVAVMDQTVKDDQQELVEDLIAITTSFSARIYGKCRGKKMGATVRQATAVLA